MNRRPRLVTQRKKARRIDEGFEIESERGDVSRTQGGETQPDDEARLTGQSRLAGELADLAQDRGRHDEEEEVDGDKARDDEEDSARDRGRDDEEDSAGDKAIYDKEDAYGDKGRDDEEDGVLDSEVKDELEAVSDDDCNVTGDDDYDVVEEECCESICEVVLHENEGEDSDADSGDHVWDDERLPDPSTSSDEDHSGDEAASQVRYDENP